MVFSLITFPKETKIHCIFIYKILVMQKEKRKLKYSRFPLSAVSLSVVSITHGQPQSKNTEWKLPGINN